MPWDNAFDKEGNIENGIDSKQGIAGNTNKMEIFAKTVEEQKTLYGHGKPYRNIIRGKFTRD